VLDIGGAECGAPPRAAGVAEVLRRIGPLDPASVWLATTDADTVVPACWLTRQLRYAEGGWDAVVGTITVTDWRQYPGEVPTRFQQLYANGRPDPPARARGQPGLQRGRLPGGGRLRPGPDRRGPRAGQRAFAAAGRRVLRTTTVSVVTSAPAAVPSAPHGFSHLLTTLSGPAEAQVQAAEA